MKNYCIPLLLIFLMAFASCNKSEECQHITDYSKPQNWINLPDSNTKAVDVFYVFPTIYTNPDTLLMDINNEKNREKAISVMNQQASVYSEYANLYAPIYQQMSLKILSLDEKTFQETYKVTLTDVISAFRYYLEHYNQGRPFIIAGHSQGSEILLDLMKEEFNNENLQDQLVAAYTIGFTFSKDDAAKYPWMKPAQKADDLGVIIVYNTQSPEATGSPVLREGALCINPLSWTTDTTLASDSLHLGAAFLDGEGNITKEIPHFTDARVREDGALIVYKPNPDDYYTEGVSDFPYGVYHAHDYEFFYNNLKENVKTRIDAYLNK